MTSQRQAVTALNAAREAELAPQIESGEVLPLRRLEKLQRGVSTLVERLDKLDVAFYRGRVEMLVGMDPEVVQRIDTARLDLLEAQLDGLREHMTRVEAQLNRLLARDSP